MCFSVPVSWPITAVRPIFLINIPNYFWFEYIPVIITSPASYQVRTRKVERPQVLARDQTKGPSSGWETGKTQECEYALRLVSKSVWCACGLPSRLGRAHNSSGEHHRPGRYQRSLRSGFGLSSNPQEKDLFMLFMLLWMLVKLCLWLAMVFVCSHMCISGICTQVSLLAELNNREKQLSHKTTP